MRAGWVTKSLGDIAVVGAGNSAPQEKALFEGGTYPFFRTSDVGRVHVGTLTEAGDRLNETGIKRLRRFSAGTILIPKSGASTFLDHRVIMGVDGYVSSHLATIQAHSEVIDTKYLYYFLLTVEARTLGVESNYPTLSLAQVNSIKVRLPRLRDQQRIVAILDEAFAGLSTATANAEKNLKNARELFDSYLNSVFARKGQGWVHRKIGDVATTQYGLSGTLNTKGAGHKIFRMGEVQDGALVDTGQMKFIDIDKAEFEQYRLFPGDVLFNRTNSSDLVGKTGLFSLKGDYCFASYLVRVHFEPSKMNSKFASYLMNTSGFLTRIRSKAARSVNQANINATILRNEAIDFPEDVEIQRELARVFEDLSLETKRLEASYQQRISKVADLKQSILQKAFSGELISPPSHALKEAAE